MPEKTVPDTIVASLPLPLISTHFPLLIPDDAEYLAYKPSLLLGEYDEGNQVLGDTVGLLGEKDGCRDSPGLGGAVRLTVGWAVGATVCD